MVVNRGEMKRKRKEDSCINLLDHSPKRTKVHAQRKFAQGSNVSSPVITPIKEIETQERKDVLPEPIELLPMKRPNTEDFLTFLCFRGTPILPPNLNFFNNANMVDSHSHEDKKEPKNGPIMTAPIGKSPNDRPFIAFGVRKRADPIVISKQMDKKRRHALALQALRRKYQEQKMAKIRAIAISKISEKVSSKNVVRTRSISKTETNTKKDVCQKTKVKVVATKRIARRTIKQPIRTNINPKMKSKMCLRSFRGRYIHRELRSTRTKPRQKRAPVGNVKVKETKENIKQKEDSDEDDESSEFSSGDDEPLVKKAKLKRTVTQTKKKDTKTQENMNIRLTRSQRLLGTRKHSFKTVITRMSTIRATTRLANKKIIKKTGVLRNTRRIETVQKNTIKKDIIIKKPTRSNQSTKKSETDNSDIKTRSKTEKSNDIEIHRAPDKSNKPLKTMKKSTDSKKLLDTKKPAKEENVKCEKSDKRDASYKQEKSQETYKPYPKRYIPKRRIVPTAKATVTYKLKRIASEKSNTEIKTKTFVTRSTVKKMEPQEKKVNPTTKENLEKDKPKKEKKQDQSQSSDDQKAGPSRPSRKTKEAAAIYMEILGHKLVNDAEIDDDISIDSFPELPNVRKTEQRENELKAKIKPKENENKPTVDKSENSEPKKVLVKKVTKEDSCLIIKSNESEKAEDKKEIKKITQEKTSVNINVPVKNDEEKKDCVTINPDKNEKNTKITVDKNDIVKSPDVSKSDGGKKVVKEKISESKNITTKETKTGTIKETKTVLSKETKTVLSKETKTVLCKETKTVLPKENKTELSKENKIALPKENKTGLSKENKTGLPKENKTGLPKDNKTILPKENKIILPKENKTVLPKENKTVLPKENKTVLVQENKTGLPKENKTGLPKENKTGLPKENKTKENKPVLTKETKAETTKNPKQIKQSDIKCLSKESENDSLSESDTSSSNIQKMKTKKVKGLKRKPKCDESFSDSDEEPLSNLTKQKEKIKEPIQKEKIKEPIPEKKVETKIENQYKNKPKRECTKRPQNYLPLYSSSDEEKFFHGFLKSEAKPEIKVEPEKCSHSVPPSDLSCKDVSRRFGKGKVNMSNEQIEKWLNDSALAGMNLKKEEDELKYEEKIDIPSTSSQKPIMEIAKSTSENKTIENDRSRLSSTSNQSQEKTPPVQSIRTTSSERKTIFKKQTEPIRNINAFSANNESSVYAFEAEEDSSISTPFRRPSRRPSSTATSKSEDDISKHDDVAKTAGRFRLPTMIKADQKVLKPDVTTSLSAEESNSTSFVAQALEQFTDNSNPECHLDTDDNEHSFYTPQQMTKSFNSKSIVKAKAVSQLPSKKMFPPSNTVQKAKSENKPFIRQSNQAGKSCDKSSETSEDFKYKIPSSPSASSSSSAKLYKRPTPKARNRIFEFSPPVNVTEFPGVHLPAQMVEAPIYHPSDKEFQDPLEYIEKLRPTAEKFGICRIVPPANFKPECKVADDMRFTAYNQYVNKMLHRWGPNFKELMAIKKYLLTQNISLTHPPWIGGMEIDLPRLYQTVQTLGGLKEVIEKKKWSRVSDAMKIPKSAQDRVTKLDDIYCKYLLPYDTLSPAEREKLFDEVETEWAKRESKALSTLQQNEDANKAYTGSSESELESDDEAEECIVKGRNMALNAFYRIARNTMSMYFRTVEPAAQEVEQEFWKHVSQKQHHICVHSGSIDSGSWGYGFAVSKNSPFARHAWNLKVLTNNSGSVLRYMGPIMGVTVPTLHVGMVFSGCCWYRDPHSLPWIEYLHTGANKIWYGIPDSMSEKFHQTLLKIVPNYCHNKSIWLPSDTVMIPPNLLVENGVSLCRTVQEPGHFIVVFPKVFTSSLSTGYVVSESVYFAPSYWLDTAQNVFEELRQNCEPSMFSLERLFLSITMDQRSSIEVLRQITPTVQKICDQEKKLRGKLREMGLIAVEKLPIPESSNARKRKKLQSDAGDYECDICRTNLFISLVAESQEDVVYCLGHAIETIEQKKIDITNCKLMFTYSYEELEGLVDKINKTIEAKLQKKLLGKSISMVVCK